MNESFAYFRLPDRPDAFLVAQDGLPAVVSPDPSPSHPGFLFAPFHATEQCPTVLIRPDVFRRVSLPPPSLPPFSCSADRPAADRRADYSSSFRLFHDALARRLLSKVVLSRCETLTLSAALPPTALFSRACRAYPHLFVSLVHTPLTGTWLVATPNCSSLPSPTAATPLPSRVRCPPEPPAPIPSGVRRTGRNRPT